MGYRTTENGFDMSVERDAKYYDKLYQVDDNSYMEPYTASIYYPMWLKVAALIPDNAGAILDLGCGPGQFGNLIWDTRRHTNYTGIDISPVAIQQARELKIYDSFFVQSAYDRDPLPNETVIALETLEHVDDFRVIERLPFSSTFIFTVPDFNDPAHIRYFKSVGEIVHRFERHLDFSHIEKFDRWFICKAHRI